VVAAYAIGAGLPLLAIAYGGRALIHRVPFLLRSVARLQQSFGVVMVLTAGLIAFNADSLVTAWVTSLVPAGWTSQLNGFETSPRVTKRLALLRGSENQASGIPASEKASPTPAPSELELPDLGQAPELTGVNHWLNSDPLTIQGLRGKVVMVDFWTYSCINCIHTLPYMTAWYNKYKEQGFVIIGVHSPEFAFEHDTINVAEAARRFNIAYPIAQDNDFATWNAYRNQYWPAEYLIDANGHLRLIHFGEGNYGETEKAIQALIAEAGHPN
jgi:thiol-disulfide isomerase/thioredoxin